MTSPSELAIPPNVDVLLVDDDPARLLSLRTMLEVPGETLVIARSADEALEWADGREFAVILLDAGSDAFETAKRIRETNRHQRTPILFLAAADIDPEDLRRGYALGAVDFLLRPVPSYILQAKVRGFVEQFRELRRARQEAGQFRLLVEGTTDYAIFLLDSAGNVVTWNPGARRIKGYAAGEIIGRHFSVFYPPEAVERGWPAKELESAGLEGRFEDEGWRVRRDGTTFWANVVITAIRDGQGKLQGFSKITRDLTDRKRAEENALRLVEEQAARRAAEQSAETIQEQRERLRVTLASIGDAVISTDADGRVAFLNGAAARLTGWPIDDARGRPLAEVFRIVNESTREPVENPALRALREGIVVGLANHSLLIARDGPEHPIDESAAPIRVESGAIVGAVLVFRDITERKRAETERARLAQTLSLAMDAGELGTWDWDPATDAMVLSPRTGRIYDVDPSRTHLRERLRECVHPDFRERTRTEALHAMAEGKDYDIEYPLQNGRWVSARGRGVYDSNGALVRMIGVVSDITARKNGETALRESEERHRLLVNAISDVVFRMNADWSEMQPLDGRNLVESNVSPSRDWRERNLPPDERGRVRAAYEKAVADRRTFELEHRVIRADGSMGWTFSRAVPILDASGEVLEWFGTARDVTEQKRAEEELARVTAESERRKRLYETILSATPDFVYVFSLDHRVTYANDALLAMWGRDWDGAVGRTFLEIGYEPWHAAMHDREIDQVRETRKPIRGEVPFNGTLGRRIYDYIFVPVFGENGEVEAVAGTTRDVTERKAIEQALLETDRRKDDFIALLAHELRNPLAPIRNGLQALRLSNGDFHAVDRMRQIMDRQLTHMVRLVDDLLDVSRIGRNKMDLRIERIDLAEVLASAVETSRPAIDAAAHTLSLSLPREPVFVDADLTRLAQVFGNLMSNSAKYTPRGGHIWLAAERRGEMVSVTVRDDGIGIPAASLPTIFDMFSQVDRSLERTTGGLGLGLALVKGLAEMHGGSVSVVSEGVGSTFTVTLPVARPPAVGAAEAQPPAPAVRGLRILVVDDNRDGAESLSLMLELLGNEVRTAHDGLEAVERARAFRPEVILMDVGMPRLNGYEATKRIRAESWGKDILIVALTGWGQEGDRVLSREAGCDDHLVKPVSLAELERKLAEYNPRRAD